MPPQMPRMSRLVEVTEDPFPLEVSWTLACDDGSSLSGGSSFSQVFSVSVGASCDLAMVDVAGDGWEGAMWSGFGHEASVDCSAGDCSSATYQFGIVQSPPPPPSNPPPLPPKHVSTQVSYDARDAVARIFAAPAERIATGVSESGSLLNLDAVALPPGVTGNYRPGPGLGEANRGWENGDPNEIE